MDFDSEKRKHKRVDLSIPVEIKSITEDFPRLFEGAVTDNLSQGGLYLRVPEKYVVEPGENVFVHISLPREKAKAPLFSRLVGKARVLRREKLTKQDPDCPSCLGLALEFNKDAIFLAVAN
ncbi:MAG: PilZ domain-containing protein [Candidatus Omnitrophota bacterium]|nr:PilZ domain-containing protein [Candidatus Omnitrophota bacterium]